MSESIPEDELSLKKIGSISPKGLENLRSIVMRDVPAFLLKGQPDQADHPVEDVDWYFYIEEPVYVHTQMTRFGRLPAFVKKIDRTIERHFKPAFLEYLPYIWLMTNRSPSQFIIDCPSQTFFRKCFGDN